MGSFIQVGCGYDLCIDAVLCQLLLEVEQYSWSLSSHVAMRKQSIYGFTGSHPDDDPMLSMAHGTNESVGIASLISGTKCMLALAYDMCGAR